MVLSLATMLDFHGGLPSSIREQTDTVTEYYLEFMAHADRVHMNDPEILLACFINGLKIYIHIEVFCEKPKSLFRALYLALCYESKFADQIQQIADQSSSGESEYHATDALSFEAVQPQEPIEDLMVIDNLQFDQVWFDVVEIGNLEQQTFRNHSPNPDLCPPISSAMKAMGGEDTATQSPSSKPIEQSTVEIQVEVVSTILPGMAESVAGMKFLAWEADANAAVVKRALKTGFIDAIVFTVDHELPVVIEAEAAKNTVFPVHRAAFGKIDSTNNSLVFDPGGMKSEFLKALATIAPISKLNFDFEPCIQMGIGPINIKWESCILTSTQTAVETNFLNDETMGFFPTTTRVKFQKWHMNWFDSSYVLIMIQSASQLFDDIFEICSAQYFCEGVYFKFTVADWNAIACVPCYYCTYPFVLCDTLIMLGSFYGERGKLVNYIVYFTHQLFEQWLMREFCNAKGLGITRKDSFWHELRINESLPCVFNVIIAKAYLTHDYSTIGWFTKTKYGFGVLPFGPTVEEFIIETNVSSAVMFVSVKEFILIAHTILYHSYWFVWTTKEAALEKEMLQDLLDGCLNAEIAYFSGYSAMASSGIKFRHYFSVLCCLIEYKVNMVCSKSLQLIVTGYATGVLCAIVFHHGGHSFYLHSKINNGQRLLALFEISKLIWVCYNWLEMSSLPHQASKLSDHTILTSDLEDKVNFKGEGNVTSMKLGLGPLVTTNTIQGINSTKGELGDEEKQT